MSDIFLEFRPEVVPEQEQHLKEVLDRVGYDDHVTIVVDATDAHETDRLMAVLDDKDFDYQSKGGDGLYYIIAQKRHYFH